MSLGGGPWIVQNKTLNGTYINFVSKWRPTFYFSDRGISAIAVELDWGPTDAEFIIEPEELQKESLEILGYEYTNEKLLPFREILNGAKKLYVYRLNKDGTKAKADILPLTATAKYEGIRGNNISVKVESDALNKGSFLVTTFIDKIARFVQRNVTKIEELENNAFVNFSGTGELKEGIANLTGGTNGTTNTQAHSDFLDIMDRIRFNTLICNSTDELVKQLYVQFIKILRDETGAKGQVVLYNYSKIADHEGVINVTTPAKELEHGMIYWVGGQEAGCNVNASLDNKLYDGEYTPLPKRKEREVIDELNKGHFIFYKDDESYRVQADINSFVEFTVKKNSDFQQNQIIRVLDQIAIDVAYVFNHYYLGKVQNLEEGRISLESEIENQLQTLVNISAITPLSKGAVKVKQGNLKNAVEVDIEVIPAMTMAKLYMTVVVG